MTSRSRSWPFLRPPVGTFVLTALAPLFTLWSPAISRAQDRWSTPHPGIRQLERSASGPRQIHVTEIDLCAAGISLRATREAERRATVPSWAAASGVEVAINADFFSFETYLPSGAAASNGTPWHGDSRGEAFVAFGRDRLLLSPDAEVIDPLPDWMREVVGGKPLILRDGAVIDHGTRELCTTRHPRTALGLSRDRQTLYLLVVDGRSSRSIGMTCAEEAALLRDLGADDAVNLDGGGSSTMWVRGQGVVNAPSDGTPRTVSNHLGVNATGSGMPSSCMPYEPEEDELFAASLATTTSDLDGDGRADACARAAAGIRCVLATGALFGEAFVGPALSDDSGWSDPANFETIMLGDVTGDGLADLCARGNAGLRCWPSTGGGFGAAFDGPTLSDESGWGRARHHATIRLADVDADGDDDVCARAAAGFRCWPSNGAGFDAPWEALAALSDAAGFDAPSGWSTIRMGDVSGDGLADVCARRAEGLACWTSTGLGFDPEPLAGPGWSDDAGWSAHARYATIRMADLDRDGRDDLCARGAAGLRCHLSTGAGFGPAIVLEALADAQGWGDLANYATISLADIDGDGDRDVCARADTGMSCWRFEDGAFGERVPGPTLSDESGWARAIYWRTIRFADVDGDGDDDLCARAAAGLGCWLADGAGFGARIAGPAWSDESGWWAPRFHSTLRLAGPRRRPPLPLPPVPPTEADAAAPDGSSRTADAGTTTGRVPATPMTSAGCAASRARGDWTGLALVALALLASREPVRRARRRSSDRTRSRA